VSEIDKGKPFGKGKTMDNITQQGGFTDNKPLPRGDDDMYKITNQRVFTDGKRIVIYGTGPITIPIIQHNDEGIEKEGKYVLKQTSKQTICVN